MKTKWYHPDAESAIKDMLESTYDKYMEKVENDTGDELSKELDEAIHRPDEFDVVVESAEDLPEKVAVAEGESEGEDSEPEDGEGDEEEE